MLTELVLKNKRNLAKSEERSARSIAKAISWRLIGTLDTILISWFLTDQIHIAISIGSIELFSKMLLYFVHERLWLQVNWGKRDRQN